MATAAAIALGLTSAVGLYGATAEEKREQSKYGIDTSGIQTRLDNETARADAANARALKLQQDLEEERKRRQENERRCCNSPAAEDAFRRANPQVLALAAEGVIGELGIVDPKLRDILKTPAKTVFRRGTILQLYELAVLAEASTQQRGGGEGDPDEQVPEATVSPPPTPASAADFDEVSKGTTFAEPPPGGWGETPMELSSPPPETAIPVKLPAISAPPATSIAEIGCLAFAALWLKHINLALGGVAERKEEKQAQEAQVRSDAEAAGRAQALHDSLSKAVNAANASRTTIDQTFDSLPPERKEFVQAARDAFDQALNNANELMVATEPGKIPTIATWQSDIESKYPDWKTTKDTLQRRLSEYDIATKGAASTKEQLPLSVRLFGPKVPPRAPAAPLFTGTSVGPPSVPAALELPPATPAASEPPIASEVPVAPEPSVASEVPLAPEPSVASEVPVAPEPPIASEVPAASEVPVTSEVPAVSEVPVTSEVPAVSEVPSEPVITPGDIDIGVPAPPPAPTAASSPYNRMPSSISTPAATTAAPMPSIPSSPPGPPQQSNMWARVRMLLPEVRAQIVRDLQERQPSTPVASTSIPASSSLYTGPLQGLAPAVTSPLPPGTTRRAIRRTLPPSWKKTMNPQQIAAFNSWSPEKQERFIRNVRTRGTRRNVPRPTSSRQPTSKEEQVAQLDRELADVLASIDEPSSASYGPSAAGAPAPAPSVLNRSLLPSLSPQEEQQLEEEMANLRPATPSLPPGEASVDKKLSALEQAVRNKAISAKERNQQIEDLKNELLSYGGPVNIRTQLWNRIATLRNMKGGRKMRKRTLKKRRGVNKRNV